MIAEIGDTKVGERMNGPCSLAHRRALRVEDGGDGEAIPGMKEERSTKRP